MAELGADWRGRFLDHPNHPSRGETYCHTAMEDVRGDIVCHLLDDGPWLPDHIAAMARFLADADFTNALPLRIDAAGWRERFLAEAFDALVLEYASELARLRTDVENHRRWVEGLQQRIGDLEARTDAPSRDDRVRSFGQRTPSVPGADAPRAARPEAPQSPPIHYRLPRELEPDLERVRPHGAESTRP